MGWLWLAVGIALDVIGAVCLKLSEKHAWLGVAVLLLYGGALGCIAMSVRLLDLGTAYAVWAGASTVLVAIVGIIWFAEPTTALRIGSMALIVLGVVGLNLTTRAEAPPPQTVEQAAP